MNSAAPPDSSVVDIHSNVMRPWAHLTTMQSRAPGPDDR